VAIQFPNNPGIGSVFTDTSAGFSYEWTGVVWKSFTAAAANNIKELDDVSSGFNNSKTTFDLAIDGVAYEPRSAAMLQISLGGVIQEPTTDYGVSGSTITFTTAPTTGLSFFGIVRGTAVAIDYAADGNVQVKQEFTATENQSSFTITNGYTPGFIDVFRNGVRLAADDITTTSGDDVVLTTPAQVGDIIETVKYTVASLVTNAGQFTNLNISGIATAGSFVGPLTGTASLASGITGTPNIVVGSVTGSTGTFTGNVSIGGTLTYQDVTNIDAVGIITAQQGIQVLSNGLDITGITTLKSGLTVAGVSTFSVDDSGKNVEFKNTGNTARVAINMADAQTPRIQFISSDNDIASLSGDSNANVVLAAGNTLNLRANTSDKVIIADGDTDIYASDVKKLTVNSNGINVVGVITANGFRAGDNEKIILGAGDDLEIYHDGTNSRIDNNTGDLILETTGSGDDVIIKANDDVFINTSSGSKNSIICNNDGNVALYYNGSEKFATSSDGVTVTGAITVTDGANLNGYKVEEGDIETTSLNGEFDYNLENGHIQKFTGATGGNYQPDFKVNGSTSLSSIMDVGDVVTCTLMVASSSHYLASASIKIDNSASNLDIDNVGGSAPSAANGSGFDIYTFTIQKTAATPAYHIVVNTLGAN